MPQSLARIEQLERELAAARREMQDFACAVSHDLRAPLRHIVSFAQLVEEDAGHVLSDEVRGFLGTVTGSAQRMGQMLDALLELSRVGAAPLSPQALALGPVVQWARECVATSAATTVQWRVAADLPTVYADQALLHKALEQVLANACKFSRSAPLPCVEVEAQLVPGGVHLRVRDNGVGFAQSQADKLGQPFVRLHGSQQFEGMGMGLAIARKAVARMGGRLGLDAQPAQGCCVTLHLPLSVGTSGAHSTSSHPQK